MNRIAWPLFAATLCCFISITGIRAEELRGYVIDKYSTQGNKGIPRVYIKLTEADDEMAVLKKGIQTDKNGMYEVKDIAQGTYKVIASKVLYAPDPHNTTKVEVSAEKNKAPNIELERMYASSEYYKEGAKWFVENDKEEQPKLWKGMVHSGLPPESLAQKAHWINVLDKEAADRIDGIAQYKSFDKEKYRKIYAAVSEARKGNAPFPVVEIENAGFGEEVVFGLVVQQLQQTKGEKEATSFLDMIQDAVNTTNSSMKHIAAEIAIDAEGKPRWGPL